MAEGNNEKLRIRLHVYDKDFPVNIRPEDEPLYRDAAALITDTVNGYASRYAGANNEKDHLYMALIDIALRYEMELRRNDTKPFSDILKKLTSEIEEVIVNDNENITK
jgi:hypothetical protein